MADYDRYRDDERGYDRGRQWNRAESRENDFRRDSLDDRNGYGVGSGQGASGLYNDRSYGNYGGGGGDYDMPSYGRGGQDRSFAQNQGSGRNQVSPRGGTYAYGAEDSARGYQRQYDPHPDRNDSYQSRDFNPYRGDYGGASRGRDHADHPSHTDGHRGFWQKAQDEVSSWMGDHEALRRRQEDMQTSHHGKGPKGYRRSDERIRDEVSDRLTDDHWLDASDIEVQVENGEVTLTGTVSDRDSKRRAERIAESASGVSDVQNNIKVKRAEASTAETSSQASGIGLNTTLDDQAAGRA